MRRWRQAWLAGGTAGLASRGQAARCRLDEQQLAVLDAVLDAGPLAAGYQDQRWTLAASATWCPHVQVQYTIPGIWYLLRRRGWTCQPRAPRHRARRRRYQVWKTQTWASKTARLSAAGSSSKTSPAVAGPPRSRTSPGITPLIRVRRGTARLVAAACYPRTAAAIYRSPYPQ